MSSQPMLPLSLHNIESVSRAAHLTNKECAEFIVKNAGIAYQPVVGLQDSIHAGAKNVSLGNSATAADDSQSRVLHECLSAIAVPYPSPPHSPLSIVTTSERTSRRSTPSPSSASNPASPEPSRILQDQLDGRSLISVSAVPDLLATKQALSTLLSKACLEVQIPTGPKLPSSGNARPPSSCSTLLPERPSPEGVSTVFQTLAREFASLEKKALSQAQNAQRQAERLRRENDELEDHIRKLERVVEKLRETREREAREGEALERHATTISGTLAEVKSLLEPVCRHQTHIPGCLTSRSA